MVYSGLIERERVNCCINEDGASSTSECLEEPSISPGKIILDTRSPTRVLTSVRTPGEGLTGAGHFCLILPTNEIE